MSTARDHDRDGSRNSHIYLPMAQVPDDGVSFITNTQYWVVRSKTDSRAVETAFRRELQSINRDVAMSNVKTLED